MISPAKSQQLLHRLTQICLTLPGATREDKPTHSTFLVARKIFAYYLNAHDRDQIVSVCCRTLGGDPATLIERHPRRFYLPPYIGPRGWIGLRLDRQSVDWQEVKDLLHGSYRMTAPRKLIDLLDTEAKGDPES